MFFVNTQRQIPQFLCVSDCYFNPGDWKYLGSYLVKTEIKHGIMSQNQLGLVLVFMK